MIRALLLAATVAATFLVVRHYQPSHTILEFGSLALVVFAFGILAETRIFSRNVAFLCMWCCAAAGGVAIAMIAR